MIKVFCDHCGKDVTKVCSPRDAFRYNLTPVMIPNDSNFHYASYVAPPEGGTFCSLNCLRRWLDEPVGHAVPTTEVTT